MNNPTSAQTQDIDFLAYCEGGREGVYERFGQALYREISVLNTLHFMEILQINQLNYSEVISARSGDLYPISNESVNQIMSVFEIDCGDVLGDITIPKKDRSKLLERMREENPELNDEPPYRDLTLEIYVNIRASEQL
ncbi:hypothetical protein HOD75_03200 [archaeon]|jgi:hypothetical protein|nr:hypothetical protein [archaeon]MBT4241880.1 hypothetical protein [archaeon]MBT4418427.1 hypothetical protein [archaeon]